MRYCVPGKEDSVNQVDLDTSNFLCVSETRSFDYRKDGVCYSIIVEKEDKCKLMVYHIGSDSCAVIQMPSLDLLRFMNCWITGTHKVGRIVFNRESLKTLVERIEKHFWD